MRDRSQYHSDNKKRRPKIDDMIRKVQKVLEDKKKDIFEDHESKVKARKFNFESPRERREPMARIGRATMSPNVEVSRESLHVYTFAIWLIR